MSAQKSPTSARDEVRPVVPHLIELSEKVLCADVWERPGLFYAGSPCAMSAAKVVEQVFAEKQS
jgi:hypothetical protein